MRYMYACNFFWDKDTADQIQVVTEGTVVYKKVPVPLRLAFKHHPTISIL